MNQSSNKIILNFIILMIAFLVIIGFLSKDSSYIMICLILPSIIAIAIDKSSDKCIFISIGFFNLGAIILAIWQVSTGIINILNPFIFKSIYTISFIGYIFFRLLPPIIQMLYSYMAILNKIKYKNKIKLLKESWEITSY